MRANMATPYPVSFDSIHGPAMASVITNTINLGMKPIAGLPLRRYRLPDKPRLVFYEVGSSNASSGPSAPSRAAGTSGPG